MKIERSQASGQSAADLLKTLQNPKPLLHKVGQTLVDGAVGRIMGLKEDPDGNAWAPWAASTLLARERKGNVGQGLLYDGGTLVNSIYYTIQGTSVVVSARAPYAGFIQNGTPKMPARPFLGIGDGELGAIHTHMRNAFRGK